MTEYRPDYASYSLLELRQARETIDEQRFPDRVAMIERMLARRERQHAAAADPVPAARNDNSTAPAKPQGLFALVLWSLDIIAAVIAAAALLSMLPKADENYAIWAVLVALVAASNIVTALIQVRRIVHERRTVASDPQ